MSLTLHLLFSSILKILTIGYLAGIIYSIRCFVCRILWKGGLFIGRLYRFWTRAGFLLCLGHPGPVLQSIVIKLINFLFFHIHIFSLIINSFLLLTFLNVLLIHSSILRLLILFALIVIMQIIYSLTLSKVIIWGLKEILNFDLQAKHPK